MYYKATAKIKYKRDSNKCRMCGDVFREELANAPESPNMRALFVKFKAGAYTKWHWHEGTQLLYGTKGKGFVQLAGADDLEIERGTRVLIPPRVWHRHGAAQGKSMIHLAVTVGETHWKECSECDKYRHE